MDLKAISEKFDAAVKQMTDLLVTQKEEIDTLGKAREETIAAITVAGERIDGVTKTLEEFKAEFDQVVAAGNRPSMGGSEPAKSVGQEFVESKQLAAMRETGGSRCDPVDMKSLANAIASTQNAIGVVNDFRAPGISELPFEEVRVRDLIGAVPISGTNAVTYVKQTGYSNLWLEMTAVAAGAQPVITVGPEYAGMVVVGSTVTLTDISTPANTEDLVVLSVDTAAGTITFTANLANAYIIGDTAESSLFTVTAETNLKPASKITLVEEEGKTGTIAHWIPITTQMMEDDQQLMATINNQLIGGLKDVEDYELLFGTGTAGDIQGILTALGILEYNQGAESKLDALRFAIRTARLAKHTPTGILVNPFDWTLIETLKGTDGHYIWANPASGAGSTAWRLPVVETTAIPAGTALVGAFGRGSQLWDRTQATIRIADQHADFAIRNMAALIAEERLVQTVSRPESFVKVTFA